MNIQEKVINGLKCLTDTSEAIIPTRERCENCPWGYTFLNDFGFETWGCNYIGCMEAALKIIKKLEPHSLRLNEIKEGEGYWLDAAPMDFVARPVICIHIENDAQKPYATFAWQYGTFSWELENYGAEWCCWSAKPYIS